MTVDLVGSLYPSLYSPALVILIILFDSNHLDCSVLYITILLYCCSIVSLDELKIPSTYFPLSFGIGISHEVSVEVGDII